MAATTEAGTIPIYNIMKKTSQWLAPTLKYEIPMAWRNWDVIFTPMEYKHYAIEITPMKYAKTLEMLMATTIPALFTIKIPMAWRVWMCISPIYRGNILLITPSQ